MKKEAVEIFGTGKCNLNCSYCYIPKGKIMSKIHTEIINSLRNGSFIKTIIDRVGPDVKTLSIWGGEPTLIFDELSLHIESFLNELKSLNTIQFSTNLIEIDPLKRFISDFPKDRKITLDLQISIDGPKWITDLNRNNSTDTIIRNIEKLTDFLNETNLGNITIKVKNKSTLTAKNLRLFTGRDKIKEYFEFFENLRKEFNRKVKSKKALIQFNPQMNLETGKGRYTVEDGIVFGRLCKDINSYLIDEKKNVYLFQYEWDVHRILNFQDELFSKSHMFTCSAGKTQFGVGLNNSIHPCHRSFFFTDDEYIEMIGETEGVESENLKRGTIHLVNEKYVSFSKEDDPRLDYIYGNYYNFTKLRMNVTLAMINELVSAGMILPVYKKYDMAFIFALFCNVAFSCPVDNLYDRGSTHVLPLGILKLMGNGAFQVIFERALNGRK